MSSDLLLLLFIGILLAVIVCVLVLWDMWRRRAQEQPVQSGEEDARDALSVKVDPKDPDAYALRELCGKPFYFRYAGEQQPGLNDATVVPGALGEILIARLRPPLGDATIDDNNPPWCRGCDFRPLLSLWLTVLREDFPQAFSTETEESLHGRFDMLQLASFCGHCRRIYFRLRVRDSSNSLPDYARSIILTFSFSNDYLMTELMRNWGLNTQDSGA